MLGADDQDKALKALESGDAQLKGGVDGKAFFTLLLQNVTRRLFRRPDLRRQSRHGRWRMIGFPGARYDYRALRAAPQRALSAAAGGLLGRREWNGR